MEKIVKIKEKFKETFTAQENQRVRDQDLILK